MLLKTFSIWLLTSLPNNNADELELLSNVDMFDAGLALIDDDDQYDFYTINHNFAESYLIQKEGFFKLKVNIGLSQTKELPEFEPVGKSPDFKTGLNVFSPNRKSLFLYCLNCSKQTTGNIIIPTPSQELDSVKVAHKNKASINLSLYEENYIKIEFNIEKNGLIVLEPTFNDLLFEFDVALPADEIHVGYTGLSPNNSKFSINTQDNHSSSWAKVNTDNLTDVYMSTGGLRARIREFQPNHVINEQIYSYNQDSDKYVDASKQFKFDSTKCRTYKSTWLDIDNDGDLDLYQGCLNDKNKLHIQSGLGSGKFIESATSYRLNIRQADEFKWHDINSDGNLDLITINKNRLEIFTQITNKKTTFYKRVFASSSLGKKLNSVSTSIKLADLDNDGNTEIFITTSKQLYIFKSNEKNQFSEVKLAELNLPEVITGHIAFVDYDYNGYLDLISFNQGIYINQSGIKFQHIDVHPELFIKRKYHFNNLIWFDRENHGQWDVLAAQSFPTKASKNRKLLDYTYRDIKTWDHLKLYNNITKNTNNWLNVDLIGSQNNLDGIGARISISGKNLKQYRQVMGTEDSYHSQGHYRQYFGLGKESKVDIEVLWPDGNKQILTEVAPNQLLKISYKKSK